MSTKANWRICLSESESKPRPLVCSLKPGSYMPARMRYRCLQLLMHTFVCELLGWTANDNSPPTYRRYMWTRLQLSAIINWATRSSQFEWVIFRTHSSSFDICIYLMITLTPTAVKQWLWSDWSEISCMHLLEPTWRRIYSSVRRELDSWVRCHFDSHSGQVIFSVHALCGHSQSTTIPNGLFNACYLLF